MSAAREPLGKHVTPRLGKERLEKQWSAIAERTALRPRRSLMNARLAFAGVAMACAAIALFVVLRRGPSTSATLVDGTWLESPASGASPAVTLADGSRVALGAKSRVRLTSTRADAVRLDVEHGRVDVQATHKSDRTFVVVARDVEVHVVGTRFSVDADGPVRVHVDEGRVRVVSPDGERAVSGGEEWVEEEHAAPAPSAPEPPPSANAPANDDDAGATGVTPRRPRSSAPTAKDLLDDAQEALAQGNARDAARMFDAIRRDHRRDARAGLAAFELGRIRLDSLHDAAGAEEAFRDAMHLARERGLRDDAEARRVEALDGMGSVDACKRARATYLEGHPSGVHRTEVAGRCGGS